jgi:hypothetical protein
MHTSIMNKPRLRLAAALTLTVSALAGTSETVTFTVNVPSVLELTTTSNSVTITNVAADYASADAITSTAAAAHQLSVRSNRAWDISVKSATANFSFTPAVAGDTRTKPASDAQVRKASGTYAALSTTNASLATGTAGGVGHPGNTFAVDYKVDTDITLDPPGAYSIDVVYTLTAP